jgi:hypothetical protein
MRRFHSVEWLNVDWLDSRQCGNTFLVITTCREVLGPARPPVYWVDFSGLLVGGKVPECEADTSVQAVWSLCGTETDFIISWLSKLLWDSPWCTVTAGSWRALQPLYTYSMLSNFSEQSRQCSSAHCCRILQENAGFLTWLCIHSAPFQCTIHSHHPISYWILCTWISFIKYKKYIFWTSGS